MPDTDRNSAPVEAEVQTCPTPDQVMEELGIGKSAYYDWINYLGIKAGKESGRAYLTNEQYDRLKELKMWRDRYGKLEGFLEAEGNDRADGGEHGELAVSGGGQLAEESGENIYTSPDEQFVADEGDRVYRQAAQLAAHRLITVPAQVVDELANKLTIADIPADITAAAQQQAQQVINPLSLNPTAIAAKLLEQNRQGRQAPRNSISA
jgi:hypothetical protein